MKTKPFSKLRATLPSTIVGMIKPIQTYEDYKVVIGQINKLGQAKLSIRARQLVRVLGDLVELYERRKGLSPWR